MFGRAPYHSRVSTAERRAPYPRIGLSCYREPASWGVWNEPADLLPVTYSAAIEAAGGIPMLLPPLDPAWADGALAGVHGLLLSGGPDVDPARYRAARDTQTGAARPDRDAWEMALARAAIARDLPVLAICRGLQVLNVALGGDLIQHLPDAVGHDGHCPTVGVHGRHVVRFAPGSRIEGLLGPSTDTATYHHQAVARLGAQLTATGWAEDQTVEAVDFAGASWVVGVQWHPEVFDGGRLFAGFVAACAESSAGSREPDGTSRAAEPLPAASRPADSRPADSRRVAG
jgi:putative glutamine amidotransferase